MSDWMEMGLRSILAILLLFMFTRIMGRRELAQMSTFDYAVGISIGAIGAELALNLEEPFYDYVLVMAVFVAIHELITWSTLKSFMARKFFDGTPIVVMEDGKILRSGLKEIHYDLNTFLKQCRTEGYFDVGDIHTAIMESSGKLSFIPKSENQDRQKHVVANVIIDGKIMKDNIRELGKDEAWVYDELDKQRRRVDEVLLATYSQKKEFNIYLQDEDCDVKYIFY